MQRKQHGAEYKAKVALEAIKGQKTVNEIAGMYGVHPTQIGVWKKQALETLKRGFVRANPKEEEHEKLMAQLYQEIGQLKMELDWLKKKMGRLG